LPVESSKPIDCDFYREGVLPDLSACYETHLQLPLKLNIVVMDDHHGLNEGKHVQTEESRSREGTRDAWPNHTWRH